MTPNWIPVYIGSNLDSLNYTTFTSKDCLISVMMIQYGTIIESIDDLVIICFKYIRGLKPSININNCVVYKKIEVNFDFELVEKAILKFKIKEIS
jgi:hypothetical protein